MPRAWRRGLRGKVLDRTIEIIRRPQKQARHRHANLARQWIEDQGVNVILDIPTRRRARRARGGRRTHERRCIKTARLCGFFPKSLFAARECMELRHYGLQATIRPGVG